MGNLALSAWWLKCVQRGHAFVPADPDRFPWTMFEQELCAVKAPAVPCSRRHMEKRHRLNRILQVVKYVRTTSTNSSTSRQELPGINIGTQPLDVGFMPPRQVCRVWPSDHRHEILAAQPSIPFGDADLPQECALLPRIIMHKPVVNRTSNAVRMQTSAVSLHV